MADIDVSSSRCAGHVVVTLRGEQDFCDSGRLARSLSAAAAPGSPVIVDLAGLAFTDCSGLGALAYARKIALQAGGDLLLAAPAGPVLHLLSLTGLIGWLPVFASVAEAADGDGRLLTLAGEHAGGETWARNAAVAPAGDDTSAVRSR